MKKTKMIATGAMMTALCIVMLMLGSVLELGMYALPLLVGIVLIPYGIKYGKKAQFIAFMSVSLISFMLIPNVEQNMIFAGFFGWYPILYPKFQLLGKAVRIIVKLVVFNAAIILVELLVIKLLVPEVMPGGLLVTLLVLANLVFLLYDSLLPRISVRLAVFQKYM